MLVHGKVSLNQAKAEEILENTALKITWYSARVYDPIIGGYVTLTWEKDAVGSGLIQADNAVKAVLGKA